MEENQMKLNPDELENLKVRRYLINQLETTFAIHKNEYQEYVNRLLAVRGLDVEKKYDISLETGVIIEPKSKVG